MKNVIKKKWWEICVLLCIPISLYSIEEERYLTCNLPGRLGNQMFAIAAAMSIAIDNDANLYIPLLGYDHVSQMKPIYRKTDIPTNSKKILWRFNSEKPPGKVTEVRKQTKGSLLSFPIKFTNGMYLDAHLWSEKFFKHNADKILPMFDPSEEILSYLHANYAEIINHPQSVGVHVRTLKGEEAAGKRRPLYGLKFLSSAIEHFSRDSLFVVFSDDISWCKKEFEGLRDNMIFMENEPYYHDFYLMSLCKHNILSNSTFSWWAAYLNKNTEKKVVAPKDFFWPSYKNNKGLTPRYYFYKDYVNKLEDFWPDKWILIEGHAE